jgi:hypothetical protein
MIVSRAPQRDHPDTHLPKAPNNVCAQIIIHKRAYHPRPLRQCGGILAQTRFMKTQF